MLNNDRVIDIYSRSPDIAAIHSKSNSANHAHTRAHAFAHVNAAGSVTAAKVFHNLGEILFLILMFFFFPEFFLFLPQTVPST